jgi:predicted DNA-binding transcriptional regulator AlpA
MRPLMKPSDLARELGVSRAWVYEGARTGRIPALRIGGEDGPLRFVPEDIEEWLLDARSRWRPGRSSVPTEWRDAHGEPPAGVAGHGALAVRPRPV